MKELNIFKNQKIYKIIFKINEYEWIRIKMVLGEDFPIFSENFWFFPEYSEGYFINILAYKVLKIHKDVLKLSFKNKIFIFFKF